MTKNNTAQRAQFLYYTLAISITKQQTPPWII